MSTSPQLQSVPRPEEKTEEKPRYSISRRQPKCPCGLCGKDIAVNADGGYRVHGPEDDRCAASGLKVGAHVYPFRQSGETTLYGTCGVCGITDGHRRVVDSAKNFMKVHNHNRPRVSKEGEQYVVTWFRYRSYSWRRRYFETHEEATDLAYSIKEHTW